MRNRFGKFILTALIMSVMLSCFGLTAYAQDYFTVTVKSGDSACSLCKENGLDYKASKIIATSPLWNWEEFLASAWPAASARFIPPTEHFSLS